MKHAVRVLTVTARATFWLLCYHYFGAEALLYLVAAWAFILGAKDLSFARVRLSNMVRPEKRRSALIKSVSLEAMLMALRLGLIAALARLVAPFNATVAALLVGLMLIPLFWARESMITLARVYGVSQLAKYATLASALSGLGAVILLAERDFDPVQAIVGALILREAITFLGYLAIVLAGRLSDRFGDPHADPEDEEEDEDSGATVQVFGADGRAIRSTFQIFIADNAVYSRWRMMQLGTRVVAHGLLGPFGSIGTRLFFSYRKPGPYVQREQRLTPGRIALLTGGFIAMLLVAGLVAERAGLLHAFGILAAGFGFRIFALSTNLLLWNRLSTLVGSDVKVRFPELPFRRSSTKPRSGQDEQ